MGWRSMFDIRRWSRKPKDLRAEIDEEFSFHVESRAEDLMAEEGLTREEAVREAKRRFGDREVLRRKGEELRGSDRRARSRAGFLDGVVQDLRTAARTSTRAPLVTALALSALALGIGANSAVFSVVDALLFPELPYPMAGRLVQIQEMFPEQVEGRYPVSPGNLDAYREGTNAFEVMEAFQVDAWTMEGLSESLRTAAVSDGFLELLGVRAMLGRGFSEDVTTDTRGPHHRNREIILTHSFWREHFGGDPDVVGRSVELTHWSQGPTRVGHTIVGVLPEDFRFPVMQARGQAGGLWRAPSQVLLPLSQGRWSRTMYPSPSFRTLARLRPGVTLERARAQLDAVAERQRADHADRQGDLRVVAQRLEEIPRERHGKILLLLWGAVGLILCIACVNVACLLLARATTRESEFAVRASLGAGRGRLVRQLFTESALLAAAGGVLGLAMAWAGVRIAVGLFPHDVPGLGEAGLNGTVVLTTLGVSLLTVFLFGWAPALLAARADLSAHLKGTRSGRDRREVRLLRTLVLGEVALAVVLLSGAALLTSSLTRLLQVETGFDHRATLAVEAQLNDPKLSAYQTPGERHALMNRIVAALEALPGVESAAAINFPPLNGRQLGWDFTLEDPPPSSAAHPLGDFRVVSRGYFETMGIPQLVGRVFNEADADHGPDGPISVVVSAEAARQWWPGADPVGRVLYWGDQDFETGERDPGYPPPIPLVVRGVVGDVKTVGLDAEPRAQIYRVASRNGTPGNLAYMVRAAGDPSRIAPLARRAVIDVDPGEMKISAVRAMTELQARAVAEPRFYAVLVGSLAGVSLLMVLAGVYGVLAFMVRRRRRELGIRLALGARAPELARRVVRQGMVPVGVGIVMGLGGVLWLGGLLERYLFQVAPTDPLTLGAAVAMVLGLSLAAVWVPAHRAGRIDPVESLRVE